MVSLLINWLILHVRIAFQSEMKGKLQSFWILFFWDFSLFIVLIIIFAYISNYNRKSTPLFNKKILQRAAKRIKSCYDKLSSEYDIVIIEGAGSPVKISNVFSDLPNMKTDEIVDCPVLLVVDVDIGQAFSDMISSLNLPDSIITYKCSQGFSSLVGILNLIDEKNINRIKGFILNKFREKQDSFTSISDLIKKKTGIPIFGVIPYGNFDLPEEDVYSKSKETDIKDCKEDIKKLGDMVAENLEVEMLKEIIFN